MLKYHAEQRNYGYVQKVAVDIDDLLVMFKLDEKGSYRALLSPELLNGKDSRLVIGLSMPSDIKDSMTIFDIIWKS